MATYKKQLRTTIAFSTAKRVEECINSYMEDTFHKSRSSAIEQILLDFFLENGYIEYDDYKQVRLGKDKYYEK